MRAWIYLGVPLAGEAYVPQLELQMLARALATVTHVLIRNTVGRNVLVKASLEGGAMVFELIGEAGSGEAEA